MVDKKLEHQLERKIKRTRERLVDLENRKETLSKHGYWSIGFYRGKLEVLEDWIDELREGK